MKASESPASLCIQDKCIQSTVFAHSAKVNEKKKIENKFYLQNQPKSDVSKKQTNKG